MANINVKSIVTAYEAGTSMRELASAHHTSLQRIRRILIDAGAYRTETTDYAERRLAEGASLDQIAQELSITKNAVIGHLPHSKGLYGLENPTRNAENIRAMRERKRRTTK